MFFNFSNILGVFHWVPDKLPLTNGHNTTLEIFKEFSEKLTFVNFERMNSLKWVSISLARKTPKFKVSVLAHKWSKTLQISIKDTLRTFLHTQKFEVRTTKIGDKRSTFVNFDPKFGSFFVYFTSNLRFWKIFKKISKILIFFSSLKMLFECKKNILETSLTIFRAIHIQKTHTENFEKKLKFSDFEKISKNFPKILKIEFFSKKITWGKKPFWRYSRPFWEVFVLKRYTQKFWKTSKFSDIAIFSKLFYNFSIFIFLKTN